MKEKHSPISLAPNEELRLPFYFFSDVHLSTRPGEVQQRRIDRIMHYLREIETNGGTLFILGDFFDFWFDCRNYVPQTLKPVIEALGRLQEKKIGIHYIGGNHDYWIRGYLTRELGVNFYPDALTFCYEQKYFYCFHGDHVVYNHFLYPQVRWILRSPAAIGLLKCLPVKCIYALGEKVSHYNRSEADIPEVSDRITNKMKEYLLNKLGEGYDIVLSGHVHKPLCVEQGNKTAAILGDWIHHCSHGIWDGSTFRLINETW